MEIKAEPLKSKNKSWFWIVLGGILMLSSLYISLFEKSDRSPALDIFYIAAGLVMILEGVGRPVQSLPGNPYIQINKPGLKLKLSPFKKGIWYGWDTLKKLDCWPGHFTLETVNQEKKKIDMRDFPPQCRHDVLQALIYHSKKNSIPCTKHGFLLKSD